MTQRYARSPQWTVAYASGVLLVTGGADALFAIEDVAEPVAAEILRSWDGDSFEPATYSLEARDVFEQLLTANIVTNVIAVKPSYAVALRFVGASAPALALEVERQLPAGIALSDDDDAEAADLLVFVRTDGLLREVAGDGYGVGLGAHLLLDVAYEHTISLGPLVFAGDTACLDCFASRLTAYWGDAGPPAMAAIQRHPALIAGLLAMTVEKVLARADRTLINATVAYDFSGHRVTRSSVYKLPMCPTCGAEHAARRGTGAFALPWALAR